MQEEEVGRSGPGSPYSPSGGGRAHAFGGRDAGQRSTPTTSSPAAAVPTGEIHLHEQKLFIHLGDNKEGDCARWILDTGATNHMIGARGVFSELDTGVHGTVRFGDGSVAGIEGRDTVLVKLKSGEHQALNGVYHIPRLTSNTVSLGQLEENDFKILMENGALKIWDQR
jgi:hypothetical protein